jgi:hypothetical protein
MDAQTLVDALQRLEEREQIRCLSLFWLHVGRAGGDSKEGPLYTVFGVVVVRHWVWLSAVSPLHVDCDTYRMRGQLGSISPVKLRPFK